MKVTDAPCHAMVACGDLLPVIVSQRNEYSSNYQTPGGTVAFTSVVANALARIKPRPVRGGTAALALP